MLRFSYLIVAFALASSLSAENQAEESKKLEAEQLAKISEAFGHIIGKNIETIGVQLDIARVVKGLQDASQGKNSPMSETECVQAISKVQEIIFQEQCTQNLQKAADFLKQNAKEKGVVSLEEGKLQYKIETEGKGALVQEHASPMIRYTGKYLDGKVFGASKEDEHVCLDETISGFTKGLIGMKEGEKRTLYIHPDLAYGTSSYLSPNSLLTFEVEVIKAHVPEQEEVSVSAAPSAKDKGSSEISEASEKPAVR